MVISSVFVLGIDVACLMCEKTETCGFKDTLLSQSYSSSLSDA